MAEAYIVDALRTPVGRRNGGLSGIHPVDLAAPLVGEIVGRSGIDSEEFDEIILGATDQVGPLAMDVARTIWLAAGLSERVPGTTIERQCGSGQQAISYAAQAVMSGTSDLIVAGGVQTMSKIPLGYAMSATAPLGMPDPFVGSSTWAARYGGQEIDQIRGADRIAEKWGFSRRDLEEFSVESHRRALAAQADGRFSSEILPVDGVDADEGPRVPNWDKILSLPSLIEGGRVTAATSSQISDGAAVMLIASERAVERHGLKPRARIHHISGRGDDPIIMLTAPIEATRFALERAGMTIEDIDLFEINEAFAPVAMAWMKETGADHSRVNVNGGAIALGHPIGATGARIMTSLLSELERTGKRFGLQTMCEGGGQANVTIIERLD